MTNRFIWHVDEHSYVILENDHSSLIYASGFFRFQGLDGSSEISGLLSNVQDIDVLTEHVINVVQNKMREQTAIRVIGKYGLEFEHDCVFFSFKDTTAFVRPFVDLFMDSTNAPRMYTINKLLKKMVEFQPGLAK